MSDTQSKSRYFLLELIINCLFFAIAAAICLNLFTYGFIQSRESRELSMASLEAQSVSEAFKAGGGDIQLLETLLESDSNADSFVLHYNQDWHRVSPDEEAPYSLTMHIDYEENGLQRAAISVDSQTRHIYALSVQLYPPEGVPA